MNCGQYVLHDGNEPIGKVLDGVAVAYTIDPEDNLFVLNKHGSPKYVERWAREMKEKMARGGCEDIFREIKIIKGNIPLDAINELLEGKCGKFRTILLASDLRVLDVPVRVLANDEPSRLAISAVRRLHP